MSSTNIEWTDVSWNPVVGCSKVSLGCKACYAESMAARLKSMALADIAAGKDPGRKKHYIDAIDDKGRWSGKLIPLPEALADPQGWRKPRQVFVNSMSDLFHESLPIEFQTDVFEAMAKNERHTYQVLTKRDDQLYRLLDIGVGVAYRLGKQKEAGFWPLKCVWLGVSVEDQKQKTRIDRLRIAPAAVRFLSLEPLLEDLGRLDLAGIHWVIVGGESGHGARPCNAGWIRSIVSQCKAAGVPCFVKQMGGNVQCPTAEREQWMTDGRAVELHTIGDTTLLKLADKKGGDMAEWPEDLRVRDFPTVQAV